LSAPCTAAKSIALTTFQFDQLGIQAFQYFSRRLIHLIGTTKITGIMIGYLLFFKYVAEIGRLKENATAVKEKRRVYFTWA